MSVFDNVAYWFYHTNNIPLYVFSEYTLQEIVKGLYEEDELEVPVTLKIEKFPTENDYVYKYDFLGSFNDIAVHIYDIIDYTDKPERLLDIPIDENFNVTHKIAAKVTELFNWYCKGLAKGTFCQFDTDLRLNQWYFERLAKHYGVYSLIEDFFIEGDATYSKYIKDPYDEQIFLIELERLKDFIANYKQLKEKHPVIIKGIDE